MDLIIIFTLFQWNDYIELNMYELHIDFSLNDLEKLIGSTSKNAK